MKDIYNSLLLLLLVFASLNFSCKKFLDIGPPRDAVTLKQAFENDVIATSAVTGIYSRMVTNGAFSGDYTSIATLNGLSADELKSHNVLLDGFYTNNIDPKNFELNALWAKIYAYIYTTNAILDGLNLSTGITETTKKQLEGEVKFCRAFSYFYLLNVFGEIPINLSTDYRINQVAPKSSKEIIYAKIIADLKDAESLLLENYITPDRVRPNKWAAKALLSRVYLYTEKWELSEQLSTELINNKTLYSLVDNLDRVFLKNSTEAIWQLMPPSGSNTQEGNLFILNSTPFYVSLTQQLISKFDAMDSRRTKWVKEFKDNSGTYYYPYKYKEQYSSTFTENSMVIRLAEMFLIRAEARAKQGKTTLALEDINSIRKRAGMTIPIVDLNQSDCILEIEKQRQCEFFSEWGHRWLDLKRTGRAQIVLGSFKGNTWKESNLLYPIPEDELKRNPSMKQNLGY